MSGGERVSFRCPFPLPTKKTNMKTLLQILIVIPELNSWWYKNKEQILRECFFHNDLENWSDITTEVIIGLYQKNNTELQYSREQLRSIVRNAIISNFN